MIIQCTKKLLDQLKIKPVTVTTDELPLFSWHANLITVNQRKTIVLVNDSNRYIVVLYGLKAKNLKNLNEIIIHSIREILLDEEIKAEIVEQFINHSPGIIYTKTKDRTLVARMNKACETVYYFGEKLNSEVIRQSDLSRKLSTLLVGDGKSYIEPNEVMYKDLEAFANQPIFSSTAVELKVSLELKNYKVWRSIIVPTHITFRSLHDILQIVFGWQSYHLHDFHVFNGDKPIVHLVCDQEPIEHPKDIPTIMDTSCKLSEYIPRYTRLKYTYDFGDQWQHTIEVLNRIEDYTLNHPTCVEGEGKTPPEDVGGECGYEEFLEAISNRKHPEHKNMVEWSFEQGYRDFNIKFVNSQLKRH
jgi:hypothetical protein